VNHQKWQIAGKEGLNRGKRIVLVKINSSTKKWKKAGWNGFTLVLLLTQNHSITKVRSCEPYSSALTLKER